MGGADAQAHPDGGARVSTLLALDPGELTGYSLFEEGEPVLWGTFPKWDGVETLLTEHQPGVVVCEAFRLYAHKAASQAGSVFVPAQVIGVVLFLAVKHGVPVEFQPASLIHKGPGKLQPPLARLVDPVEPRVSPPYSHVRDALAHGHRWLKRRGAQAKRSA